MFGAVYFRAFAKQALWSSNAEGNAEIYAAPGAAEKTMSDIITGNLLVKRPEPPMHKL